MRAPLNAILPPLVPLVLLTVLAEAAVRAGWVASFLVPAPSRVFAAMTDVRSDLWPAAWETAWQAAAGFALSVAAGMAIGAALTSARWVQRAFYPYAVFFQTVPIIAVAPLLVIWVGWDRTVIASAFIVSIFPVIASTLAGLRSTDPALTDLFRLYGAGPAARLVKLRLPSAMPSVFTGLQVAAGLAVVGAIVGEFITGTGIGGLITVSRQRQRVDILFAGLILAAGLGVVLFTAINVARRLALRHWDAAER